MNTYLISKRTIVFTLPILVFSILCIVGSQTEITLADTDVETNPGNIYFKEPSTSLLGVWISGGFRVNLKPDYYVKVGEPLQLETHSTRGVVLIPSISLEHSWFEKRPQSNWQQVQGANTAFLDVDTSTVGTTYYQTHHLYKLIPSGENNFYSKVAAVHVLPNDVPAKSVKINVDNDYIYNLNNTFDKTSAFASAELTPNNATEKAVWSISDTNLANIDQSGNVTAVPGKEGSFFIKATVTNKDGSTVTDSKIMNVGGGLYDEKARAGERATFKIQGFDDALKDDSDHPTVEWHKKNPNGKDSKLTAQANPFIYVTDPVSEQDNGTEYYAIIKLRKKSLTTSMGKLTVLPTLDPNVVLTGEIKNSTLADNADNQDNQDTSSSLFNIVNGDTIDYKMHLNNNGQRNLQNNELSFYLSLGTEITSIIVGDKTLNTQDYKITSHISNGNQLLEIPVGDLKIGDEKDVQIKTSTHGINNEFGFRSVPSFTGSDSDKHLYQSIGNPLELHYITNKVIPHFKDIQFESIYSFEKDVLKYRTSETNYPNDIVYFDDQRRNKTPLKVFLQQPGPLFKKTEDKTTYIPFAGFLKFHEPKTSLYKSLDEKIEVAHSLQDQALRPIRWNKNEGLLLYVNGVNLTEGHYSTQLTWVIQDGV